MDHRRIFFFCTVFSYFSFEVCKTETARALTSQFSVPFLNPQTSERLSYLASSSQDKRNIPPPSLCQTIHQVKANSQNEQISAQKHISITSLITPSQLEKQKNYSGSRNALQSFDAQRAANSPTSPLSLTYHKTHFQFYNLKAGIRFKRPSLAAVIFLCISAGLTALGPGSAAWAREDQGSSSQATLPQSVCAQTLISLQLNTR